MKGYTIQHSIDLLEKQVEAGGSGGSTAADISYDNTSSHLTADDVQEAIDELNTNIGTLSGSIPTISDYGVNYSTTERIVGTWIDDTTLYEKTVHTEGIPNYTDKSVAHGISDLGTVVDISGFAVNTTAGYYIPIPYVQNDVSYQVATYVDSTNIHLTTGRDMSAYNDSYVTLRYTKVSTPSSTRNKKTK